MSLAGGLSGPLSVASLGQAVQSEMVVVALLCGVLLAVYLFLNRWAGWSRLGARVCTSSTAGKGQGRDVLHTMFFGPKGPERFSGGQSGG